MSERSSLGARKHPLIELVRARTALYDDHSFSECEGHSITQLLDSTLIINSNNKNKRALQYIISVHTFYIFIKLRSTFRTSSDAQWFVCGRYQDRYPLGTTTLRFCGFTEIRQADFRIALWKGPGLLSSWPSLVRPCITIFSNVSIIDIIVDPKLLINKLRTFRIQITYRSCSVYCIILKLGIFRNR